METESEEYRSHNSTESDIELKETGLVVIQDVSTVSLQRHWLQLDSHLVMHSFFFFLHIGLPVNVSPS